MADSGILDELRAVPQDQRLRSGAQWRVWIGHIRTAAINENVWEYLNPELSEESVRQVPKALNEPRPSSIREEVQEAWRLTKDEYTQFTIMRTEWDRDEARRLRLQKVMARMDSLIKRSLATEYHYLIVDEDSPRKQLVKLAKEFKPKEEVRTEMLRMAWRAMIKQPTKDVNIDHWLTQWKNLYEEGLAADVPDIAHGVNHAIRDFLRAVQPMDDFFSSNWLDKITTQEVTFQEVISAYASRRAQQGMTAKKPMKAAFATLNGQSEAKAGEKAYRTRCPCGRSGHRFNRCFYLVKSSRPEGWKPNEEVRKKIPEVMKQMSPSDQEAISKLLKDQESAQFTASHDQTDIVPEIVMFADHGASDNPDIGMFTCSPSVQAKQRDGDYHLINSWILDTGASCHICNDRTRFITFTKTQRSVRTGDSSTPIEGTGDVRINLTEPSTGRVFPVRLTDVRYSPRFLVNLVSASRIKETGYVFDHEQSTIKTREGRAMATALEMDGLYVLEYNPPPSPAAYAVRHSEKPLVSSATAERWHRRLGHMYDQRVERLSSMVEGVQIIGLSDDNAQDNPERCETCQLTNARRQISRRQQGQTFGKYGRIHFDLVQFDTGYNGHKWMTHFYAEGVRLHVAFTHEKKSGCQEAVKHFCSYAKTQWDLPIQAFRYDNERSAGRVVQDFLTGEGFIVEHSVVGTPEMNSFAERSGGVIITTARALLLDAGLPKILWPEAVKAAIWIINRSPTKLTDGRWIVPYAEAMENGRVPKQRINLSNLRVYGCRAYVRRHDIPNSHKMEPRAAIGYLVGYVASNIWKVWFPHKGSVREVRDVVFDENRFFDPKELEKALVSDVLEAMPWEIGDSEEEEILQLTQRIDQLNAPAKRHTKAAKQPKEPQQEVTPSLTPSIEPQTQQASQPPPGAFPEESTLVRSAGPAEQLQNEVSSTTPRHRAPRDIVGDVSEENIVLGSRKRKSVDHAFHAVAIEPEDYHEGVLAAFATGLNGSRTHTRTHRDDLPPEPRNWKEMLNHPYSEGFLAACGLEIETIQRKETFEVVRRPIDRGIQVLPLIWVFTYKLDSNGFLSKLKARICVRGDLQKLTNEEKYSATLAARTARAVFALVAAFDLDTYQYDAVNAFLNSVLDEVVYTEMPEGFRKPGMCWKLLRALYGLRKSPCLWQREASRILTSLGLQVVQEDLCLFTADGIIIFFYVDDIIIVNHPSQRSKAADLRKRLNAHWELRDIGEAQWFLGIRIIRDREQKALWLCQDSYISSMANRYHLTGTRAYGTPLPAVPLAPYHGQATQTQIHEYQQKVGSAQYATTVTRTDAAKHTASLAQFLTNPGPEHLEAVNRVIAYLYHTRTMAIAYHTQKSYQEAVQFFSDASFGDNHDRKSSEGYICMMFGGPVDWKASKQRTVTTSTTEAELLAISETGRTVAMWKRLFDAIRFDPEHPLAINCDNQQTIGILAKEAPQLRTKLRHVDIHHHWLRQEVQEQRIHVRWVETRDMVADGLTKLLPRQKHAEFVKSLGMQDIQHLLD
jgi:Reverse transcriptase (RNA-dependent DNA polymerase).